MSQPWKKLVHASISMVCIKASENSIQASKPVLSTKPLYSRMALPQTNRFSKVRFAYIVMLVVCRRSIGYHAQSKNTSRCT